MSRPLEVRYLEEGPDSPLEAILRGGDLLLAEVHKVPVAQRGLQKVGALQEGRLRDDLAHVHHVLGGLLRVRRCVVQGHELAAKLQQKREICVKDGIAQLALQILLLLLLALTLNLECT